MTALLLGAFALVVAALGVFRVLQALVTGRARGIRQTADRVTQPARFWLSVAVLFCLAVASSSSFVWSGITLGFIPGAFHARHPPILGPDAPDAVVAASSADGCEEPGPRVCLVTVGADPDVPLGDLARDVSALVHRRVGTLTRLALVEHVDGLPVVDERRQQVGAAALERLVRTAYPMLWRDAGSTILIFTGHDLWLESNPGLTYGFGSVTVRPGGGGFAVVSSARMDPVAYGRASDAARLTRRMHVLVGKYLAMLLYGEKPSPDPASPVYSRIESPDDLDGMSLFTPPAPDNDSSARRSQ